MRKILFGVVITLIVLFTFKYCGNRNENKITLQYNEETINSIEGFNNLGINFNLNRIS